VILSLGKPDNSDKVQLFGRHIFSLVPLRPASCRSPATYSAFKCSTCRGQPSSVRRTCTILRPPIDAHEEAPLPQTVMQSLLAPGQALGPRDTLGNVITGRWLQE
jgi:hypothetical protein